MSLFRLYGLYVCTDLKINVLRKSPQLVLKIGPIQCRKFDTAGKLS